MFNKAIKGGLLALCALGLASTAMAGHARVDRYDTNQLDLAYEIKQVTKNLDRRIQRGPRHAHHAPWRVRRAQRSVHRLAQSAHFFLRQAERFGPRSRRAEQAFHELVWSFDRAQRATYLLRRPGIRHRVAKVGYLIDEARPFYDGRSRFARRKIFRRFSGDFYDDRLALEFDFRRRAKQR